MASDDESLILDPCSSISNPFTKAKSVKSAVSSAIPAQRTRFISTRRPVKDSTQQPSQPQLTAIPPYQSQEPPSVDRQDDKEEQVDEQEVEQEVEPNFSALYLQTPGPGSSIS